MTRQLLDTYLKSNLVPVCVFIALNTFFAGFITLLSHEVADTYVLPEVFIVLVSWLLVIMLFSCALLLYSHHRERRTRLLLQLPVTPFQVRSAHWLLMLVALCLSTLVLALLLNMLGLASASDITQLSLLYFFHAAAVIALITFVITHVNTLVSRTVRRGGFAYYLLLVALTFGGLILIMIIVSGYVEVSDGRLFSWTPLTLVMLALAATLISGDLLLYRRMDNYLG